MARAKHSAIQAGQWFQQNRTVWEVMELKSLNDIPHVRIMKVSNTNECKLISASALRDGYVLAPDQGPKPSRPETDVKLSPFPF